VCGRIVEFANITIYSPLVIAYSDQINHCGGAQEDFASHSMVVEAKGLVQCGVSQVASTSEEKVAAATFINKKGVLVAHQG
jgi:hypothetical protein